MSWVTRYGVIWSDILRILSLFVEFFLCFGSIFVRLLTYEKSVWNHLDVGLISKKKIFQISLADNFSIQISTIMKFFLFLLSSTANIFSHYISLTQLTYTSQFPVNPCGDFPQKTNFFHKVRDTLLLETKGETRAMTVQQNAQ